MDADWSVFTFPFANFCRRYPSRFFKSAAADFNSITFYGDLKQVWPETYKKLLTDKLGLNCRTPHYHPTLTYSVILGVHLWQAKIRSNYACGSHFFFNWEPWYDWMREVDAKPRAVYKRVALTETKRPTPVLITRQLQSCWRRNLNLQMGWWSKIKKSLAIIIPSSFFIYISYKYFTKFSTIASLW